MRVVSLHPDVLVATSAAWQTTCTVVRSADEAFVIDSPVFPGELDLLPSLLAQAGFPLTGLLATHGDWDHLLGRLAFPDAPLGCAETTAARLTGEPGAAARKLREFDDETVPVPAEDQVLLGVGVLTEAGGAGGPGVQHVKAQIISTRLRRHDHPAPIHMQRL